MIYIYYTTLSVNMHCSQTKAKLKANWSIDFKVPIVILFTNEDICHKWTMGHL